MGEESVMVWTGIECHEKTDRSHLRSVVQSEIHRSNRWTIGTICRSNYEKEFDFAIGSEYNRKFVGGVNAGRVYVREMQFKIDDDLKSTTGEE
ncbi:hypothetical protein V1477_003392 [Vespula maculifrons]|uniref:Uncharacterized protein n=1 Tax=Vespula maculifrons TaxID=7453 RepID=A0ABD2CUD7_VESMC